MASILHARLLWIALPFAAAAAAATASPAAAQAVVTDCAPHSYPQRTDQSLAVDPFGDPSRPTGVRPSDIAMSHQDSRVMYLSGSHGSVYRTADGGATWRKVLSGAALPE